MTVTEEGSSDGLSRGSAENWLPILGDLKELVGKWGHFHVLAIARGPLFARGYRSRVSLHVSAVSTSVETWEICIAAPGLARSNPKGASGLVLSTFLSDLEAAVAAGPHCVVVISDDMPLDRRGVQKLAQARGADWVGPDLDSIAESEYIARLDLPIRAVRIKADEKRQQILLEVQVS